MAKPIPDTVRSEHERLVYAQCNNVRAAIKELADHLDRMRTWGSDVPVATEAKENVTLAYRHLEDASMRLGKVLQALDGGVSVYDRDTTVGA